MATPWFGIRKPIPEYTEESVPTEQIIIGQLGVTKEGYDYNGITDVQQLSAIVSFLVKKCKKMSEEIDVLKQKR